jgi:integrase
MATFSRRKKNGKPYGKWLIRYKDENEQWRTVAGYADKETTKTKARGIETDVERRRQGIFDPFEAPKKVSLADHLSAFERHLEAKGDDEDHIAPTKARIQAIFDGCGFGSIASLCAHDAADKVNRYLAGRDDIVNKTKNYYLTALIGFCRWATKQKRMAPTPLATLDKLPVTDSTRERRALSSEQFAKLIEAAKAGKATKRLTGEQRAFVYMVAAYTGLRAGELASLTPTDFGKTSVTVRASMTKNAKLAEQPLRADLVKLLRPWLSTFDDDQRLWPGRWYRKAAKMLQVDLKAAGIPYKTAAGVFDFHSLRVTYVTELVRAGIHPRVVQSLARHSTITLTMASYTKLEKDEIAAAVDSLPAVPKARSKRSKGAAK